MSLGKEMDSHIFANLWDDLIWFGHNPDRLNEYAFHQKRKIAESGIPKQVIEDIKKVMNRRLPTLQDAISRHTKLSDRFGRGGIVINQTEHGQEMVLNAPPNRRLGMSKIELLNKGVNPIEITVKGSEDED